MYLNKIACSAAFVGLASPLLAQFPPVLPLPRTLTDHVVVDTTNDRLWRLVDFDQDGLFHTPGEVTLAYDDTIGAFAWNSPSCVTITPDGRILVGDVSTDFVYVLRDLNGDGDYQDAGEIGSFFDPSNLSGVVMDQSQGITVNVLGHIFVAVSHPGTGNTDKILRLEDLNADGDANDLGEASIYYDVAGSSASNGFSIPTEILVGPDLALYWNDVGTGLGQRGVWRLFDANFNGNCNDPGEATLFWNPSTGNGQYWSLAIDQNGAFYVTDHVGEIVYRGFDLDGNQFIDGSEQTVFYQTSGSTWWDLTVQDDGSLFLFDSEGDDHITRLVDLDADGTALGIGEAVEVYNAGLAAQAIAIRGAAVLPAPQLQLLPNTASVGTSTQLYVQTTHPGDAVLSFVSLGLTPPVSLPPYGLFELDPVVLILFDVGNADANRNYSVTIPLPFDFGLIGTYGVQAVCGDPFRAYLSNSTPMTLTP